MKKLHSFLFLIYFMIVLFSCSSKKDSHPKSDSPIHTFSATYKSPVFVNDNRKEKIKNVETEIQELIADHTKSSNIPGAAYGIVVDDELVIAGATGSINLEQKLPATTTSSFRIASMTKSFTAMAIMKLRDEGKLSIGDPVSKYVPEMNGLRYLSRDAPIIDIENLLTMTAGFPEDNRWGDRQLNESDEMLIDLVRDGISFSNSTSDRFEYSNTGYALLGHIVSKVSGVPFQDYIQTNILKPLGMEQTYWEFDNVSKEELVLGYRWQDNQWKLEPMLHDGAFGAMGGLITSIEDFSKYVSFQLSAWPPRNDEDTGPVKRSTLREMQTPQFASLNSGRKDSDGNPCAVMDGYGFGLRIDTDCNGLKQVGHGGALPGFGSNFLFFPEYGIGIMAFGNRTYTPPYPRDKIVHLLFKTLELQPRILPVSDVLQERKGQIMEMIQGWEPEIERKILAENFYIDQSREFWIKEIDEALLRAGKINSIGKFIPFNQLRGYFEAQTENGKLEIFFTLTPEEYPKVQYLDVSFQPN